MSWVNAIVQGLLLGGLYALFATGLSLLFGVMRVTNLAHGDLAVAAAYLAVALAPVLGLGLWAFVLVVPLFAGFGYVLQRSLIQASLDRGPLTTLLVTFGLSVVIENLLLEMFTADSHSLDTGTLSSGSLRLSGQISVGYLSLTIFALAVAVLLGLQFMLSRTATGRLIRAVADDREAARLSGVGYRHVFGVAAAIAFATLALAGLAFGMYSSFAPSSGTGRLLFAFEAVVIGGLGSLWGTLAGGIVLGVAQAVGGQVNLSYSVIAGHLVFLAVLALRPEGLTGRLRAAPSRAAGRLRASWLGVRERAGYEIATIVDRVSDIRLPRARAASRTSRPGGTSWRLRVSRAIAALPVRTTGASYGGLRVSRAGRRFGWPGLAVAAIVAVLAFLPYLVYSGTTDTLVNLFILLTMASTWNLLAGYAGLVSVGQQAFVGLGAYLVLVLAQGGFDPFAAIPLAAVGCGAAALAISFLVFRLRGGYFAVATWVVADVCQLVVSRFASLGGGTGAALPGLSGVDPGVLSALTYWAALTVAVVVLVTVYLVLRTRLGLALTAIRDDEAGARGVGVRVARAQRIVYVIAALGCGAAGALLIVSQLNVEPASAFSVRWSAQMIFVTVIGGIGSIEGPVLGTILFFVLQQSLAQYGAWYLVILGAVAIAVAIWTPRGLWGLLAPRLRTPLFPTGYQTSPTLSGT
ncbi:ABC transporter permease [Sphaerisporangium corydalis]|uniref:ABC transporter permease n=1 Tax=Sphaerisporangium corydalis TaxID=1441875 RepID=A0ABV9ENS8_9ACTN|nr:ABC transporter permease [Sphaerisporangium corydalis]